LAASLTNNSIGLVCIAVAVFAAGCQVFDEPPSDALDSILKPVQSSPESVVLEVFQARVAPPQQPALRAVWGNADETRFDSDLRSRLSANGFRVGVISEAVPRELASLLALQSEATQLEEDRQLSPQTAQPQVSRHLIHVKRNERSQVVASELRHEIVVLFSKDGRTSGATYHTTQPTYSLRGYATDGQRVVVELVPELQHGELRNRYSGGEQGILIATPSREREVFDELLISADLEPGELLLLSATDDAAASLGHAFHHAESAGATVRKIIVIRAAEVPPSELFARN